ncbi:Short-chain dehydrogenase/reductase SDR [Macrophomina phaseolina MS6]|uniref:Short-chain dehydrogenase/reductase SDR n=1 Tax=Macrophomina phaseolina (strain MS6) TaxID=1126212 RepID=K2S1F5_MACPH|nr:Short-chain dehydrogenase/reductase SDR [Macrophomina phaseolina MS6]
MQVGDFPLSDKIVVVTGGGSGIGLQIVKEAVAAGSKVILADLRLTQEVAAFVRSRDSKDLVFQKCDVSKRQEQEKLVEVAEQKWGDVPDVYISSAGLFEPLYISFPNTRGSVLFYSVLSATSFTSPNEYGVLIDSQSSSNFWTDTEADDYATVSVNVTAPIKLTRIAMRALLRKNKKGVVLLVSSIAGYGGTYAVPLYCATKHAVVGFVKSMRKAEQEEGVKVVALCPGVVRTPLWSPDRGTDLLQLFKYSQDAILEPEDVARAAKQLVEEGRYGGGTVLEVTTVGTRVIPEWGVMPPPQAEKNTGAPQEIVPPAQVEVKEYLKEERGAIRPKL